MLSDDDVQVLTRKLLDALGVALPTNANPTSISELVARVVQAFADEKRAEVSGANLRRRQHRAALDGRGSGPLPYGYAFLPSPITFADRERTGLLDRREGHVGEVIPRDQAVLTTDGAIIVEPKQAETVRLIWRTARGYRDEHGKIASMDELLMALPLTTLTVRDATIVRILSREREALYREGKRVWGGRVATLRWPTILGPDD